MAYPKKTFGQHIEDGLTFMGDGIHQAVVQQKDHELEGIKSGFIRDEGKLQILKQELYKVVISGNGNPEHIQNLRSAITTISNQLENERNHRNTLSYHLYGILNSIILLGILTTFFSFPVTWVCNVSKSQSKACQVSRIIPKETFQFFSEPK